MARQSRLSELFHVPIENGNGVPLQRQLYEGLRAAIVDGRLVSGGRLPSSRRLAGALSVSRNTAIYAIQILEQEGYVRSKRGSGTYVVSVLPDRFSLSHRSPPASPAVPVTHAPALSRRGRSLSTLGARFSGSAEASPQQLPFDLGPDWRAFPFSAWARSLGASWRNPTASQVLSTDPAGYPPLRAWIAEYLGATRSLRVTPEQVFVVSGSQHALDLASRLLLDPGSAVLVEDPSYPGIWSALSAAGARPLAVPVDADGFDVRRASRVTRARAAVVTPSHQFPLGMTLSLERRFALLEWAHAGDRWIIEDDYDSEFRYETAPVSSLQGLDPSGRVLYVGTFSKVLLPSLRLGYLVVPIQLLEAFRRALRFSGGQPSLVTQVGLYDFVSRGHFTSHLRTMRNTYAQRRRLLLRQLSTTMPRWLTVRPDDGGMHLVADFTEEALERGAVDVAIEDRAADHRLSVRALSRYARSARGYSGLLLGFAGHSPKKLQQAAMRLDKLIAAECST